MLRSADDSWGEKTITWLNQPGPTGPALASASWASAGPQDFDVSAAVVRSGPVSFVLRQAAGCTAKADVVLQQPGVRFRLRSSSSRRRRASRHRHRPPRARTAVDNDADGLIDHPADRGMHVAHDADETDPPPPPACADGVDNDADGLVDHPADPGCTSPADTDETDPSQPLGSIVAAAAGDVACDPASSKSGGTDPLVCQHRATAGLLTGAEIVLPLGDLQYPDGALDKFLQSYDPTWGQHAPATYPAIGNHEYNSPGAQGYFDYWASKGRPTGDPANGYYSFDAGRGT